MEELIGIANQLQDIFTVSGLRRFDLPQIVVVGTQSSGKSSVLEHLVGRSFLPRGTGIVTRCPLELRLVNIKDADGDYGIFKHKKTEVFRDYLEITKEIEDETKRLAGGNKGICSTPICLTMYSATFTNLTLVDLPGLTKVPVGNQPEDIEKQTSELILKYIKNPNSIIVAVVPANADMATCESLKIAREVDREGARTLAVVTKLDLMDEGTDAKDMLSGSVIPVKLGIIGVVNRSQKGIRENKSMEQSLKDELEFLSKYYKDVELFHGTPYLRKTIQTILVSNITQYLPELKIRIGEKLQKHRLEMLNYKNIKTSNTPKDLVDLILKFSNNFCAEINGNLTNIDTKSCKGGARIYKVFRNTDTTLESINPLTDLSKNDLSVANKNARGISETSYKQSFELLVKEKIKQMSSPCLKCVDLVFTELIKIFNDCINDPELKLDRYPILRKEVTAITLNLMQSCNYKTKAMVLQQIDIHLAYINYDLIGFKFSNCINPGERTFKSCTEGEVLSRNLKQIKTYFSNVRNAIKDTLPKIIMRFLVNSVMERLLSELMLPLYYSQESNLFQESPKLLKKMNKIKESILTLEKADTVLNTISNSTIDSAQKIIPSVQKNLNNDTITQKCNILISKYLHFLLFFVCLLFLVVSYCLFK